MGFLKTDYTDVADFGLLPIGDYECIVSEVKVTESSTKKPMVKVTLTIRDDVEQEGKKRKFFDNLVVQDNMMWKFQQVSKACQFPADTDFSSVEDFASAIQFKNVIIRNKHEEYNGEKSDKVANWKPSKGSAGGSFEGGSSLGSSGVTISDDDLPF